MMMGDADYNIWFKSNIILLIFQISNTAKEQFLFSG